MIKKEHILTALLLAGLFSFWGASQFYDWKIISGPGYDKLYSIGLILWAIRHRLQSLSLFDEMCANIVFWLCLFNVYDEFISSNPFKPDKPYIVTIIVILSCILTYYLKCRKLKRGSRT